MPLTAIYQNIVSCRQCGRLSSWCKKIATEKRKSFADETYWGKPVPGFGDPNAEILIIGLAPAAHGANRTGRMFTGDNSGKWLYRALFEHGFSSQEESVHTSDDLKLKNAYITSIVHCAPPDNKPTLEETKNCIPFFEKELDLLPQTKIILALGAFAWKGLFQILREKKWIDHTPKFAHGAVEKAGHYTIVGSYHPSQQNTFTGKLTKPMFDDVFIRIKDLLK